MAKKLTRTERKELRESLEKKIGIIPYRDLVPDWDRETDASFKEAIKKGLTNSFSTSTLNQLQRFPDIVSSRLLREATGYGSSVSRSKAKSMIEEIIRSWKVR